MAQEKKSARRLAREAVFTLLYETEFHEGETPEAIFELAVADRDLDAENKYLKDTYFGVMEHLEEVDTLIGKHAKGWKTNRLSRVSRAVLRLATYEMLYVKDVPQAVAINEGVELSKEFDDPKARPFINGVLNAIKNDLNAPKQETSEAEAVEAEND